MVLHAFLASYAGTGNRSNLVQIALNSNSSTAKKEEEVSTELIEGTYKCVNEFIQSEYK
jgi:hypothetical protein